MREPNGLRHEEYLLTKVDLAREDVPAEALALLSAWIEGEGLLVDDREEVGGIDFCRMDAKVIAPLPHIFASLFACRPYRRKVGHSPRWNGFYLLLYRDVEQGWKLLQMRRDTSHAEFIPVLAAHARAVEGIEKQLGNDPGGRQEPVDP
jgi:hypothetical protein